MVDSKKIGLVCLANLLLISCNFNGSNSSSISKQNKASIEDLADGNYRYFSDPNPYPVFSKKQFFLVKIIKYLRRSLILCNFITNQLERYKKYYEC